MQEAKEKEGENAKKEGRSRMVKRNQSRSNKQKKGEMGLRQTIHSTRRILQEASDRDDHDFGQEEEETKNV